MLQTIITTIITSLTSLALGICVNKIRYYRKTNNIQNKALKNIIKSNLVNQYYAYKNIGKVPKFIKEAWYSMYESYVDLDGNSFIRDDIKPKWDSLEIDD